MKAKVLLKTGMGQKQISKQPCHPPECTGREGNKPQKDFS